MPLILRISTSGLQLAMIRLMNSPFLHYQQVSGSEIINIGKAGNHLPPWPQGEGGGLVTCISSIDFYKLETSR